MLGPGGLPVTRVRSVDDFNFGRAEAMHFNVLSGTDEARDVAAELESLLRDLLDLYSDLDPVARREAYKDALAHVHRLEALGCAVSAGLDETKLRMTGVKDSSLLWHIWYVVVWATPDVKDFVAMERAAKIQFQ